MVFPSTFQELLLSLMPVMTQPTFENFSALLPGWLFAGRRTVTGIIQAAGLVGKRHHSIFHRLFASARWSLDELGLAVFGLLLPWLSKNGPIFLAADDTLARKRGLKIFGVGMHHDPLLSTRKTAVVNWGHNCVVLGVVLCFPFRKKHYFCLPILFRLYRSKQTVAHEGGVYRKRPELLVEMLEVLAQAYPQRRFHLLADSAYCGKSVGRRLPENFDFTGRAHLDAQLFAPPPARKPGERGRARKRGARKPSPRQMLATRTRRQTLDIYGRRDQVRIVDDVALWYNTFASRLLRIVAVQSLNSGRKPQAFFSTCVNARAAEILSWYARRWSIETTFQDTKGYLGFEQPQGWTPLAVQRTAPVAMLLYSLIVLWFAKHGQNSVTFPVRPWYSGKRSICFVDTLRTLRRETLSQQFMQPCLQGRPMRKTLQPLIELLAMAA